MVQTIYTILFIHDDKTDSSEFAVYKSYESLSEARCALPDFFVRVLAEAGIDISTLPGGIDGCRKNRDSYVYECPNHYYECCIDINYLLLAGEED